MPKTAHIPDDESRISKELKALKKLRAPWYFEAELHKRLRIPSFAFSRFSARRMPAYAISSAAVIALAVVGYSVFFRVEPARDRIQLPVETRSGVETPRPAPPILRLPERSAEAPLMEKEQKGPHAPGDESMLLSRIPDRRLQKGRVKDSTTVDSTKIHVAKKDSVGNATEDRDTLSAN